MRSRAFVYFSIMAILFVLVGVLQSWNVALTIVNLCIISAIMALGVNIQWGYAGLFNVGIMGFAALGGLAGVLVSMPPVYEAWSVGGEGVLMAGSVFLLTIIGCVVLMRKLPKRPMSYAIVVGVFIAGLMVCNIIFEPARSMVEAIEPAKTGYFGGLGLPVMLAWPVGGVIGAGAAWIIGKISLKLRSDYLAIATLGISEIIVAILKNEDWLARGVKNVTALPRPVAQEVVFQKMGWVQSLATDWNVEIVTLSSIIVKLCYVGLFGGVLLMLLWLIERSWHSPWGRMMRAIRDNEVSAAAMGKDIVRRHLQVFVLGSAVIGIAGAMMVSYNGQFTPSSYHPLRYTFLIWVMVIVGGSGNNWGSVLGGFLIWFYWVEAEPIGLWLVDVMTGFLGEQNALRLHLLESAAHMRLITMGVILLLVMRFNPRGLLAERA